MKREKQMGPMNVMFFPPYVLSVSQVGGYFHESRSHKRPCNDHQRKRATGGTQMDRMTMSSVMLTPPYDLSVSRFTINFQRFVYNYACGALRHVNKLADGD